jgi:hypothetical protein
MYAVFPEHPLRGVEDVALALLSSGISTAGSNIDDRSFF